MTGRPKNIGFSEFGFTPVYESDGQRKALCMRCTRKLSNTGYLRLKAHR